MKKRIYLLIIPAVILILFFIRLVSPKHLDDVSPEINCDEKLLEKADYLAVIPNFNNKSISENREWCEKIINLNKKLVLHGIYHTYKEFETQRDEVYMKIGVDSFEKCFNQTPTEFKPPQLAISKENKAWMKNKYKIYALFSQITHKTYHCEDTGRFPNWMINFF